MSQKNLEKNENIDGKWMRYLTLKAFLRPSL